MTGKIAVITGASRGLGASMARHLAARQVAVVGTYRDNKEEADVLAAEIEATGGNAAMLPLDVSSTSDFQNFAVVLSRVMARRFGRNRLDFLVNNAGIGFNVPFGQTTEEQFDQLVRIHFKAPFFLTQALLPLIADGGQILNVSSNLTRFTVPGYAAYASAKAAIEVLTRYEAKELGDRRIRVNVIAPGAIETDFAGGRVRDNAAVNSAVVASIPLGRIGQPDDIGRAVAALLSDDFGWTNGTRIEVSGGQNV